MKRVPCVLLGADERQSAVLALTENIQREQLTFFEVAFALRRLQEDYGLTQAELARRLSLSQPAVANKLRLLRLSDEEMQAIVKYGLTERHARELIRLQDGQQRKRALSRVILEQLSVSADAAARRLTFAAGSAAGRVGALCACACQTAAMCL